jgi:mRNA-degrading endonuclease RelE of RelBE toxin-antitoxin system
MRVELTRRAERDLRAIALPARRRLLREIGAVLSERPLPAKADDRPLRGSAPWRRLRVGEWRVIWREENDVRYVARIVNRRDLERAVRRL